MAIPSTAEAMGQAFSAVSVSYATRLTLINDIREAVNALHIAIENESVAEVLATDNASIKDGEWDEFRGNGVSPNQNGINDVVQAKGELLFTALNALS